MVMTSRRRFLQSSALAAALGEALHARRLETIGVQLYTVRSLLPDKAAETLRAINDIGYREAEATFAGLDRIWPALEATKLKPVSIHLDSAMVTKGEDDAIKRALDDLKHKGFQYAVYPYVPPTERGGLDVIRGIADKFNRFAEKCRA